MNTPQLSSSPLSQSQSMPQLQFSPLKPLNLPVLANDTEMEQAEARGANRSWPLAMTPPALRSNGESTAVVLDTTGNTTSAVGGGSNVAQQQTTAVPSSSPSSQTSSPKAGANSEGLFSPTLIPFPITAADGSGTNSTGSKPMVLSGLSQLLGRSSSGIPTLDGEGASPSTTTTLQAESGRQEQQSSQYGEMLPTGSLDAVTSAAAAAMEGV